LDGGFLFFGRIKQRLDDDFIITHYSKRIDDLKIIDWNGRRDLALIARVMLRHRLFSEVADAATCDPKGLVLAHYSDFGGGRPRMTTRNGR
jgi:hypothetical protein